MCGILFILSYNEERRQVLEKSLCPLLHHRGPDAQHSYCSNDGYNDTACDDGRNSMVLCFHGTVLHLRGDVTKQPLVSDEGHVLLWNGEIFDGDVKVPENENDTSILFERLQKLPLQDEEGYHDQIISLFGSIQGPWAFVFYDAYKKYLWYGRDYFGRRSLLSSVKDATFCLSSLGHRRFGDEFTEVPAKVLYCLDLNKLSVNNLNDSVQTYPMHPFYKKSANLPNNKFTQHRCLNDKQYGNHDSGHGSQGQVQQYGADNIEAMEHKNETGQVISHESPVCTCFKSLFESTTFEQHKESSKDILDDHNRPPDTNVLECLNQTKNHIKCCQCLAFENFNEPPAVSSQDISCNSSMCDNSVERSESICSDCNHPIPPLNKIEDIKYMFFQVLQEAVCKRVYNIPRSHCVEEDCKMSKVGILFSGGIDSVVLTALADRCTPSEESIDLINVAFAQKQKVQQNVKKQYQKAVDTVSVNFDVPDRLTGRMALKELPRKRRWNFIEVDVTLEELQEQRKSRITNLVYPLDSVLDDSIGCAIWFAARGVGKRYILTQQQEMQLVEESYASPVKVLLTGMGADEQLGGYARHRTKFESSGWVGLQNEMAMELERISSRNMGRDDRCISDHGREARFPFLDENVVSFLQEVPVCVKCDPRLPRGSGEKILLRELASSLGLCYTSSLPKRAIQFGSKIAKMESSKEKGSDNCKRLENVQLI